MSSYYKRIKSMLPKSEETAATFLQDLSAEYLSVVKWLAKLDDKPVKKLRACIAIDMLLKKNYKKETYIFLRITDKRTTELRQTLKNFVDQKFKFEQPETYKKYKQLRALDVDADTIIDTLCTPEVSDLNLLSTTDKTSSVVDNNIQPISLPTL